jgi:protein-tyrosine-phosphatase
LLRSELLRRQLNKKEVVLFSKDHGLLQKQSRPKVSSLISSRSWSDFLGELCGQKLLTAKSAKDSQRSPRKPGAVMAKPKVLFLCTGNSARSQMAEGLLRHLSGDRFEVLSAGTHPVGINPLAVEAMQEVGIDISRHYSKDVREFLGQPIEYVVTVCDRAKESCPSKPGQDDTPTVPVQAELTSGQMKGRTRTADMQRLVRKGGLEPPWVSPPDPKSGASANSATFAGQGSMQIVTRGCLQSHLHKSNASHPTGGIVTFARKYFPTGRVLRPATPAAVPDHHCTWFSP